MTTHFTSNSFFFLEYNTKIRCSSIVNSNGSGPRTGDHLLQRPGRRRAEGIESPNARRRRRKLEAEYGAREIRSHWRPRECAYYHDSRSQGQCKKSRCWNRAAMKHGRWCKGQTGVRLTGQELGSACQCVAGYRNPLAVSGGLWPSVLRVEAPGP